MCYVDFVLTLVVYFDSGCFAVWGGLARWFGLVISISMLLPCGFVVGLLECGWCGVASSGLGLGLVVASVLTGLLVERGFALLWVLLFCLCCGFW